MMGLTAKQSELLGFIEKAYARTGVGPSYDEMKVALGLRSNSGILRLVNALEARGRIRRLTNKARSIEVLGERRDVVPASFHPMRRTIGSPDVQIGPGRPVLISIDGGRQS